MFVVVAVLAAIIGLHGRLPSPRQIGAALADADWRWIAAAAVLQALSIDAFASQERVILAGLGVRVRRWRMVAIATARSSISMTFPAGAALSAGYAVRQYRRAGATAEAATVTMVAAWVASVGGVVALYLIGSAGLVVRSPRLLWTWPLSAIIGFAVLGAIATVLVRRTRRFRVWSASTTRQTRRSSGRLGRLTARVRAMARDALRTGARLRPAHWLAALAFAAVNRLTDLLCLGAATRAAGFPIGITTLAGIYLGVQIVRQIPLTPGGVGVIETVYVTAFVAAGDTAASAAAAVIIYRLLSYWILIPAGGVAAQVLSKAADVPVNPVAHAADSPDDVLI
ncbi:membrane protein [Rugosimonospora africana]|uniref:Membrane protein n=1 Tax=Rugosimonospora africana TaxID=556532 RepID=A0A8J3QSP1_9ACTN|nr:membrane protein [Rugosimonospora africana]